MSLASSVSRSFRIWALAEASAVSCAVASAPPPTTEVTVFVVTTVPAAMVEMAIDPADTGGTHVAGTRGATEMRTLDAFRIGDLDFLKIDCEGYELEVLKGARETLARCRPCIIVEQKPHKLAANYGAKGKPAVDFLLALGLGYVLRREMGGDFILSCG